MTAIEIINLAAIVIGPIAAVVIGLWLEDRREKKQRKLETFRMLMRTRMARLSGDHVAGLNIVELEFRDAPNVMAAWKHYMEHLDTPLPAQPDRVDAFLADRNNRFTKLLYEIGVSLGFRIEQLDILRGNYAPQAWANDEEQQRELRTMMVELLAGQRPLPVMPHNPNPAAGVYPPAPVHRPGNGGATRAAAELIETYSRRKGPVSVSTSATSPARFRRGIGQSALPRRGGSAPDRGRSPARSAMRRRSVFGGDAQIGALRCVELGHNRTVDQPYRQSLTACSRHPSVACVGDHCVAS